MPLQTSPLSYSSVCSTMSRTSLSQHINSSNTHSFKITCAILCGIIMYFLIFGILQFLRGNVNVRMHRAYDVAAEKTIDIFMNYEIANSFGMLEMELDEYTALFEVYLFYMRINWLSNCLLDALKMGFVLSLKMYLYTTCLTTHQDKDVEITIKMALRLFDDLFQHVADLAGDTESAIMVYPVITEDRFKDLEKEDGDTQRITKRSFEDRIDVEHLGCSYGPKLIYSDINSFN